jgi:hypothetical protein
MPSTAMSYMSVYHLNLRDAIKAEEISQDALIEVMLAVPGLEPIGYP